MGKKNGTVKRIVGTLALPVIMYVLMMILCYANGKTYFGSIGMWKTLIVDIAVSVTCAYGIGIQFKNGRFDFSGGAIMLLAAIIAGNTAKNLGSNPVIFCVLCMVLCVGFSLLVGCLYVFGRLPIIIATIAMALLYESVTCLIFNGGGLNLVANMQLKIFSTFPTVLIPLIGAIVVYWWYSYKTVAGKQSAILANNQQSAVNIGVNEPKNVLITYLFGGIIFGFATMIYATTGQHEASFTSLATISELFTNILPVFVGLLVAGFCGDTIGTIVGSVTLCTMTFGLEAIFTDEMGSVVTLVITGIFILLVNVLSSKGKNVAAVFEHLFRPKRNREVGGVN
ncbi:MAG: hypothetical protein LUD01_03380 [Clostridiales bacterium]|nr:hypothetical protein [Clostridiales bacterium]